MKFKEIKVGDLLDFVDSTLYKESLHLPISKNRALSQYHNPRANKGDIALLLALDNTNQIIGFIGALPEQFAKFPNQKIAWNTGWWVDPVKGKHVAMPLFFKLMSLWSNKLMFSDMTAQTERILFRLNQFTVQRDLVGYRFFVKIDLGRILPKRNAFFLGIKPLLHLIDFLSNTAMFAAYKSKLFLFDKKNYGEIVYTDSIDAEAGSFIQNLNTKELFRREEKALNWILKYPWLDQGEETEESKRYFFSQKTPIFKNFIIKIYSTSGHLIAVLFLTCNNQTVKLPYIFSKEENYNLVVSFLYRFLLQQKATSFITYNALLVDTIKRQKGRPFWLKKPIKRAFVVSNNLLECTNWDFSFQEGNSDVVFT